MLDSSGRAQLPRNVWVFGDSDSVKNGWFQRIPKWLRFRDGENRIRVDVRWPVAWRRLYVLCFLVGSGRRDQHERTAETRHVADFVGRANGVSAVAGRQAFKSVLFP